MIFNFRLVSDEVEKFRREIKIDADATFLDLRDAICESVGYSKGQMCSFFLCNEGWEKDKEITLEDMGLDTSEDAYLMEDCVLRDFIEDDGQRLIFVFDYLTDRCFFLEMKKSEPGKNLLEPICSMSMGTPPPQEIDIEEVDATIDAKAAAAAAAAADMDMDSEFYGDDQYNEDEIDLDNLEELDI